MQAVQPSKCALGHQSACLNEATMLPGSGPPVEILGFRLEGMNAPKFAEE